MNSNLIPKLVNKLVISEPLSHAFSTFHLPTTRAFLERRLKAGHSSYFLQPVMPIAATAIKTAKVILWIDFIIN